jgi:thiol peroxidase
MVLRKGETMQEREGAVTFKGSPLTLIGDEIKVGQDAPNVTLVANDLSAVELASYRGRVCVVSSVPSLDTPVCDVETRRFNQEAAALGENVAVLTVSMDLPFAQARWCGAAGVERVTTLSDHLDASFGTAYGVLIKGLRLLARAIFVVDKDGDVQYVQVVDELTNEPDYDAVIEAVKKLT